MIPQGQYEIHAVRFAFLLNLVAHLTSDVGPWDLKEHLQTKHQQLPSHIVQHIGPIKGVHFHISGIIFKSELLHRKIIGV